MKIALIIPKYLGGRYFLQPPLGFLISAELLRKKGSIVKIFDDRADKCDFSDYAQYDVLILCTIEIDCIQNYFVDYRLKYALEYAQKLKLQYPEKKLVIVGAHGTLLPKKIMNDTNADIVVCGEFETVLADLSNNEFNDVGIIQSGKDLMDIDFIPAFDLIDFKKYFGYNIESNGNSIVPNWSIIQASRGCPYSCTYCYNFYGKKVRTRSVESIIQEIKYQTQLGAEYIFFIDNIFGLNQNFTVKLLDEIIAMENKVKLYVQTRADTLNDNILEKMRQANFAGIWLGVESFDDKVLSLCNKHITGNQSKETLQNISKYGITPAAFMMMGLEGQTTESVNQDIEYLKKENIRYNLSTTLPRLGTLLYNKIVPDNMREWNDMILFKGNVQNSQNLSEINKINNQQIRIKTNSMSSKYYDFHSNDVEVAKETNSYAYGETEKQSDIWIPFLSFPITGNCNFKCLYCGIGGESTASNEKEFKVFDIINIAESAIKKGVKKFRITGGEPFLHKNIQDILKFFSDIGYYTLVNTNGSLLLKYSNLLSLLRENIKFAVSLDTLKPDVYKKLNRGKTPFSEIIDGIKLLKELNLLLRVNMVVNKLNYSEIYDIIKFCQSINCDLKLLDVVSVPIPYGKRTDIYAEINTLEDNMKKQCDKLLSHEYSRGFGTPCLRYKFGNILVTVKNSTKGSHYDTNGICKGCNEFPCHEGLYDIFALSDKRVCSCRWSEKQEFLSIEEQILFLKNRFQKAIYVQKTGNGDMRIRSEILK